MPVILHSVCVPFSKMDGFWKRLPCHSYPKLSFQIQSSKPWGASGDSESDQLGDCTD